MSRVDMHLAELSRSIDPVLLGQRLRSARVAAGLRQADLAGSEVSAAYVSRIEAGQRRPEATLLERFAHRLGVDLEALLGASPVEQEAGESASRVLLDHAELSLVSGDATGALEQLEGLDAELVGARPRLARKAEQIRALAYEAVGRTDEAICLLEDLVGRPEADIAWLKSAVALSRCYREGGDFARAIAAGERAMTLIEELELSGTTEAIQLTVTIAGAYLQRGDLDYALQLCARCVEAADRIHSPVAKASAYWNASVSEHGRGNTVAALDLAQRSMVLFEVGEDSRNLGRLRTQLAFIQMRQTPPDAAAAKQTLEQAGRELAWSAASELDKAEHHVALGKAELLLDNAEAAQHQAEIALELIGEDSPVLRAETHVLIGQIHAGRGDVESARGHYRRAIADLTAVAIDRDVARLWFDLAHLLEEAEDAQGALDAYRRGATAAGLADARVVKASSARP